MSSPANLDAREQIFTFLQDTDGIYALCRKYSILIEELIPTHKAPLHAANELKSLVFHLYKAANTTDINDDIVESMKPALNVFEEKNIKRQLILAAIAIGIALLSLGFGFYLAQLKK